MTHEVEIATAYHLSKTRYWLRISSLVIPPDRLDNGTIAAKIKFKTNFQMLQTMLIMIRNKVIVMTRVIFSIVRKCLYQFTFADYLVNNKQVLSLKETSRKKQRKEIIS